MFSSIAHLVRISFLFGIFFLPSISSALTLKDFATKSQYMDAKLSPDGKHVAVRYDTGESVRLIFFRLRDMKVVGNHGLGSTIPGEIHWVNNERIVVNVLVDRIGYEQPGFAGELYAVNLDGDGGKYIFGYRARRKQNDSRIKKTESTRAWGRIVDVLPKDPKHILISAEPYTKRGDGFAEVRKLNVYNGKSRYVKRAPAPNTSFHTDQKGELRFAHSINSRLKRSIYETSRGSRWKKIDGLGLGSKFQFVAFTEDDKVVYVLENSQSDKIGLYKLDIQSGKSQKIYVNEFVDITNFQLSSDRKRMIALEIDNGTTQYIILSTKDEEAKIFKNMTDIFSGHRIRITSKSDDGSKYLVKVSGDTIPGSFYLFDRDKNSMVPIFAAHETINSKELSYVEPFSFRSSDNIVIHGYLTLPKNSKLAAPPMVVLIHGGPRARDYWEYDSQVQMLAYNGYAVLQVNYRGSEGYGEKFERAGYKQWGGKIQQDIIEATLWAVNSGKINSEKICIMGASFGAYSALFSAIKAPDLYQCIIANAGVYDLNLVYQDDKSTYGAKADLNRLMGDDETVLHSFSPIHFVEKLKATILVMHGEKDKIAPFAHAERLRTQLDKYDKHYEWFIKKREGHGFFANKNRIESYHKILSFLSENL